MTSLNEDQSSLFFLSLYHNATLVRVTTLVLNVLVESRHAVTSVDVLFLYMLLKYFLRNAC